MSTNSYTNETDWLDGDWVADDGHPYGITGRVKYDRDGLRYRGGREHHPRGNARPDQLEHFGRADMREILTPSALLFTFALMFPVSGIAFLSGALAGHWDAKYAAKTYPPISELAREFAFRGQFVEVEEKSDWSEVRLARMDERMWP